MLFLCDTETHFLFPHFQLIFKRTKQSDIEKLEPVEAICKMLSAVGFRPSPPKDVRNESFLPKFNTSNNNNLRNTTPQVQDEGAVAADSAAAMSKVAVLPWVKNERPVAASYAETLKYGAEEDGSFHPKRRKRSSRSLTFNETVTVVAIPMRNEYSSHVRSKLWSSRLELQQNAARNAIEFVSEG